MNDGSVMVNRIMLKRKTTGNTNGQLVIIIHKKEQESAFSFYHLKAEIVVTAALQSTLGF